MTTHPITTDNAGGEYMEAVLVIEWAAKPGMRVKAGDLLVTVETAKAATEIEAGHDGWLAEVFFEQGQEAPVGAVLGTISETKPEPSNFSAQVAAGAEPDGAKSATSTAAPVPVPLHGDGVGDNSGAKVAGRIIATPLARRVASAARLDLSSIAGSGPNGRIKRRDVDAAIGTRDAAETATQSSKQSIQSGERRPQRSLPLVLLHGFGAERTAWRQVLPLLPAEIEVVRLDLPGHGSEAGRSAADLSEMALLISDRLEALGIDAAHVAGHSLGAASALALTGLGRVAVQSLTLFAPAGLGPDINGAFIAGLLRATTPEALEPWLKLMVGVDFPLPKDFSKVALRQMEAAGNCATLTAMARKLFPDATQAFDLVQLLKSVTAPTRIVWGRDDRVIPSLHSARVPDFAAVHLIDGVGHVPHIEVPALAARLIVETVRSAG